MTKREQARAASRRWRERHPDRYRAKYQADNRYRKYGLTLEKWQIMMDAGCGICGTMNDLVVDHDHKTDKVRGVLCRMHNSALGQFDDDPDMLRRAIRWLEEHS